MSTSEKKAALEAGLPAAGLQYKYELPEYKMGDTSKAGTTSTYSAKQDLKGMSEAEATIAFTPGCDRRMRNKAPGIF